MRGLVGLSVILTVPLLMASPAAASCAPPASVSENAGRAVAVVYGTVTDAGGGTITLHVDRVLKGSAGGTVTVNVGPGRDPDGAGGTAVATSVDYDAKVGSDHVLYLIEGEDGQLETNACIGSHAGAPTAEEVAYFGAATSPGPATPTPAPEIQRDVTPVPAGPDPVWPALVIVLLVAMISLMLGMRARRDGLASGSE